MKLIKASQSKSIEFVIKQTIIRKIKSTIAESHLLRSKHFTMNELIEGFPNYLHHKSEEIVNKMCDEFILSKINKEGIEHYYLNPNKHDTVKNILNSIDSSFHPPEDLVPRGYKKLFESYGVKSSTGFITKYMYFANPNNPTHFFLFIQNSLHGKSEKRDLGLINKKGSILGEIWYAINKKLKKDTFYKQDLQSIIDPTIIGNNQPLKAGIDVLCFLKYIEKTGRHKGRSDEYRKTNKQASEADLNEYLNK